MKKVFRDALDYSVIDIVEGRAGLFGLNPRPFTLGNTIYTKEWPVTRHLLVHETMHAWQYQHSGVRYAGEAVLAQWLLPDAYNWQREIASRGIGKWIGLNREAQAQFFEDLWREGECRDRSGAIIHVGNGAFFDALGESDGRFKVLGKDYTTLARRAVDHVRSAGVS